MRLLCLIVGILSAPSAMAAETTFTHMNTPGPHAVGFKLVEQYDRARSYRGAIDPVTGKPFMGERARPVQTWVWYPADKTSAPVMTLGDYEKLAATADSFPSTPADRVALVRAQLGNMAEAVSGVMTPQQFMAKLATPLTAHREAAAETGRFPVIIYAASFNATPLENADLCEYLASQGYIVIGVDSIGQASRLMTISLEGAEAQAADIGFAIGYAGSLPQADTNRLAVIGYSWGGLANVLAAAKDSRIGALVVLDGSVTNPSPLFGQATYATEARATAPMLYVASGTVPAGMKGVSFDRPDSPINHMKYADIYRVTLAPMMHQNFSETALRFGIGPGIAGQDMGKLSSATVWMETYTLRFLDAYLKDDGKSHAFLDLPPAEAGASVDLVTSRVTHAEALPPTRVTFAAELGRQGFDQAPVVYQAFRTRDPDFALTPAELVSWGYDLLARNDLPEAIAILKLNTDLHPDDWNAFDSLGEAYADHGDAALAIAAYRQSLVLNPQNTNATDHLKSLGA
ncbi:MAG: dienelactone hydrolase family protein [Asticcacaulis sp.]|uniref:dienelactone hydrolase family protein n=1 Tax=Asticcacaulis sp. TaxID=1872648 RepID=UPI0039E228C4